MNDFGSRLERELLQAAKREQRRANRAPLARIAPKPRPILKTTVAIAAVAALVLFLPPALRPPQQPVTPVRPGPVPTALAGGYSNGAVRLILDRRRYTLVISAKAPVTGTVAALGPVLTLEDDGEGACRPTTQPARYRATLTNRQLRLERLADHCPTRAQALQRPLQRDR